MTRRLPEIRVDLPDHQGRFWPVLHVDNITVQLHGVTSDTARIIGAAGKLLTALTDLHGECEAMQGPELRDDRVWGPLMRAGDEAIAAALPPTTEAPVCSNAAFTGDDSRPCDTEPEE